jgi:hypothetical protein
MWALTNYGRVLTQGNAQGAVTSPLFGWDIARDIESAPDGNGYYILDGFGGVHEMGGAPPLAREGRPYFNIDIARDFEIYGNGYLLLDGYGWIHSVGDATSRLPIDATGDEIPSAYFGWDIARDIEMVPDLMGDSGYYVMDGFGAVHRRGMQRFRCQTPILTLIFPEILSFYSSPITAIQIINSMDGAECTPRRIGSMRLTIRGNWCGFPTTIILWAGMSRSISRWSRRRALLPDADPNANANARRDQLCPDFYPTMMSTPTATMTQSPTPSETGYISKLSVLIDREILRDWSNQVLKR